MAHSLLTPTATTTAAAAATSAIPISTTSKLSSSSTHSQSLSFNRVCACHRASHKSPDTSIVHRRSLALALGGVVLGLNLGEERANAARRPPPPPPEEKKDPNVSGVTAKVLASKKRKEAMKQTMAKLREKGKAIIPEPSQDSKPE